MTESTPEIPNTPEEMFPKEFDVYTTKDVAEEMLRVGNPLGASDMLFGFPEKLGVVNLDGWDEQLEFWEDSEIIEQIDALAEREQSSREEIIRELVRRGLEALNEDQ